MRRIIRIIAACAGVLITIAGFLVSGAAGIGLILVGILAIIQVIPQIIDELKPKPRPLDKILTPKDLDEIRKAVQQPQDLQTYLDGLPETENKKLRNLFEKGQDEDARAAMIAEAIRQGEEQETQQFYQTTLKAIEFYKKGLSANPKTSERCALQNLIGLAHYKISYFDEAVSSWEEVIRLAAEMIKSDNFENVREGKVFSAIAYCDLGLVCVIRGELGRAEELYQKSLAIDEELDNIKGIASNHGNLGNTYRVTGKLDKAEEMYRKALVLFDKLQSKEGMAKSYGNLGIVYGIRGELNKAEEMHLKSLAIETELSHKEGMASVYGNLGVVYNKRGHLGKAEESYQKALVINKELGRKEGMANLYGNLGTVYKSYVKLDKAENYYRQALQLFQEIGAKSKIEWARERLREIGKNS